MRTEVKTLIAALTTERNSLDRAIAVLAELDRGATPAAAVKTVARAAKKPTQRRVFLAEDIKRQIGMQMADAKQSGGDLLSMAKALSKEFGAKTSTIYCSWNKWARSAPAAARTVESQEFAAVV